MVVQSNVKRLLEEHTTLDLQGIDRLYLNAYQPTLQTPASVVYFFKYHLGHRFDSTDLMGPMTRDFVRSIEQFSRRANLSIETFPNDQRKESIAQGRLAELRRAGDLSEGVYLIGKAQEKCPTFRTHKHRNPQTGATYGHIFRSTVMCNQYYFFIFDDDFGPLFIKFSSYFPYNARICPHGHEYLKRQAADATHHGSFD